MTFTLVAAAVVLAMAAAVDALQPNPSLHHVHGPFKAFEAFEEPSMKVKLSNDAKTSKDPEALKQYRTAFVGGSNAGFVQPVTMSLVPSIDVGRVEDPVVVGTTVLQGGSTFDEPSVLSGTAVDTVGRPRWARQYPNISVTAVIGHGQDQVYVVPAATPAAEAQRGEQLRGFEPAATMAIAYGNVKFTYTDSSTFFIAAYRLSDGHPMWSLNFTATRVSCVVAANNTHDAVCLVTQPNSTATSAPSSKLPPWGADTVLIYVKAETGEISVFGRSPDISFDRLVAGKNRRGVVFAYLRNTPHVLVGDFVSMTAAVAPPPPVGPPAQVFYLLATVDGPIAITTYAVACPLHGTAAGDNITTDLRYTTRPISLQNRVNVNLMVYVPTTKQLWFWGQQGQYYPFRCAAVGLWNPPQGAAPQIINLPIQWNSRINVYWSPYEPRKVFVMSLSHQTVMYANVTKDGAVPTRFATAFDLQPGVQANAMVIFPDTTGVKRILLSTYFSFAALLTMDGEVVWKQALQNSYPLAIVNHQRAKDPLSQVRIILSGGSGCETFWGQSWCNTGYVSVALPAAAVTTAFPSNLTPVQYGASVSALEPVAGGKDLIFSYSNGTYNTSLCRYSITGQAMACSPVAGAPLQQGAGLVWNHNGEDKVPTTVASLAHFSQQYSVVVEKAFTPQATTTITQTHAAWGTTLDGLQQLRGTDRYFFADASNVYELSLRNASMVPKPTPHFASVPTTNSAPFLVNGHNADVVVYVAGQDAITYFFPDVTDRNPLLRVSKPADDALFALGPLPLGPALQNSVLISDNNARVYRFHPTTGALIWSRLLSQSDRLQQLEWRRDRVFAMTYRALFVLDLATGAVLVNTTTTGLPMYSIQSMLLFGHHTDAVTASTMLALFLGNSNTRAWMIRAETGAVIGKRVLTLPASAFDSQGRPALHLSKDGESMMLLWQGRMSSCVYKMTIDGTPLWEAPFLWLLAGTVGKDGRAVALTAAGVAVVPSW